MKVPLLDLQPQYEALKDELESAVLAVCRAQGFILGPRVEQFERELAAYCKTRFALGVSSGTDALILALMALDIGPGDEVITTPFTFFATAGSIARVGARPVFTDIEPDSFNLAPGEIERRVTPRTKAIMPVHLFGQCADMGAIMDIAKRRKLAVIEDACQAIGADCSVGRAGGIGDCGCFSFYPSKNLSAFGDAGAFTTNDEALYHKAKLLRAHGEEPRYYHHLIGGNFRLGAIQAAALSVKLPHLEKWHAARIAHARRYMALFLEKGLTAGKITPPVEKPGRHIFNQYTIRATRRDELMAHLRRREIGSAIYYPVPLHLQKCFANLGYKTGNFPVAEQAAKEALSLPVHPDLNDAMLRAVAAAIAEFYTG